MQKGNHFVYLIFADEVREDEETPAELRRKVHRIAYDFVLGRRRETSQVKALGTPHDGRQLISKKWSRTFSTTVTTK